MNQVIEFRGQEQQRAGDCLQINVFSAELEFAFDQLVLLVQAFHELSKRLAGDGDVTQFDGETTRWSDLRDDLATASLFDMGGKRTIVVRGADKFVSEHRGEVEKYIAKPGSASRFILELDSLAASDG